MFKNLFLAVLFFLAVVFFLADKTYSENNTMNQSDTVQIKILTYIYLGETDNDFFITCSIEKGEVVPDMLLDAVCKTGKRFSVKIDKIEKYLFTDVFIPSAKTGDSVCLRAKLNSGNASGFNHEDYVLVNTGAPYFEAIKK
ncbi:MAG: hypothetical protein HY959_02555 [Ignavibacteriae bacterium]|nr:hypothetical protein [Ignavibacteriota bacterium]